MQVLDSVQFQRGWGQLQPSGAATEKAKRKTAALGRSQTLATQQPPVPALGSAILLPGMYPREVD